MARLVERTTPQAYEDLLRSLEDLETHAGWLAIKEYLITLRRNDGEILDSPSPSSLKDIDEKQLFTILGVRSGLNHAIMSLEDIRRRAKLALKRNPSDGEPHA